MLNARRCVITTLLLLAGCGGDLRDSALSDEKLPYPRGTCFEFTARFPAARSRTFLDDHYSFVVWVKPENLRAVPCTSEGSIAVTPDV